MNPFLNTILVWPNKERGLLFVLNIYLYPPGGALAGAIPGGGVV